MTIRSTMIRSLTTVALLALVACGDGRLTKLSLGMSKDSLAAVMQAAPHRTASYLLNGKVWEFQVYEVGSSTPAPVQVRTSMGQDSTVTDSIPWRKMSPVVMIDGKVVGWGWGWWDKESAKLGLPMQATGK